MRYDGALRGCVTLLSVTVVRYGALRWCVTLVRYSALRWCVTLWVTACVAVVYYSVLRWCFMVRG